MQKEEETKLYRTYVGNSLWLAPQNKMVSKMYSDLADPGPVDNRTGDEISLDVITKLGLEVSK